MVCVGLGFAHCWERVVYVCYEFDGSNIIFYFDGVPVSVEFGGDVDVAYDVARRRVGASPYWR